MAYQNVIISSAKPNLVLGITEGEVKLQTLNESPSQIWSIEPAGHGKHYIVNKGNGKVLALQGRIVEHAILITHERPGGVNPEWYINSDNTIVTASGNLAVDIFDGNMVHGAVVQVFPNNASTNQKFYFQNH